MSERLAPVEIPQKASFKPSEVCELLQVPAYVLRTWENEFKDLGVAKTPGGTRAYRRNDVELAARIRELVFTEHLTLAGVRRRLEQEQLIAAPVTPDVEITAPPLDDSTRTAIAQVKTELRSLLQHLAESAVRTPANAAAARRAASRETPRRTRDESLELPGLPLDGDGEGRSTEGARPHTKMDPAALDFATVAIPPSASPAARGRRAKHE
jgi:DNA-binding transcriptional MerR regulator